jgi:hypothetical protein
VLGVKLSKTGSLLGPEAQICISRGSGVEGELAETTKKAEIRLEGISAARGVGTLQP